MKLFFLIRSLDPGGAERQLAALGNGLARRGHEVHIGVFYPNGALEETLDGPTLHPLNKTGRWDVIGLLARLTALVRKIRPDLAHGYLGTANLFLSLVKPFLRGTHVFWGVRASNMDHSKYSITHLLHWKMEALCSPLADCIVYNSKAGQAHAERSGFSSRRSVVIPNGIDTDYFVSDPASRSRLRSAWGIKPDEVLVGLPARLDPMKDHHTLLNAVKALSAQPHRLRFVCIGDGPCRAELESRSRQLGLEELVQWAGEQKDMPAAYSALDICCLTSSFGEGFPNVLGEALSCGVPCIATDVGDARSIVGDCGTIVAPGDVPGLAHALLETGALVQTQRAIWKTACRERAVRRYALSTMIETTEKLFAKHADIKPGQP